MDIPSVAYDSRAIDGEGMFVAIRGTAFDGHRFIEQAVQQGATAVLCEILPDNLAENVAYIECEDTHEALAIVASNFYENPSEKLTMVAVTGTNGKTTIATLLYELYKKLGYNSGLLSTICLKIMDEELPATHTTPDPLVINETLQAMVKAGVTHCFMEASSHSIDQKRIFSIQFDAAIFSNITHDHLDYHQTFENYINAKKKLFDELKPDAFAVVNVDDRRGRIMLQNTKAEKITYGIKSMADFKGRLISDSMQGLEMDVDGREVWFRLLGSFNAYNMMAVYATAVKLGEDPDQVLTVMSELEGVNGRFNKVDNDQDILAIIDYAHTPDALENVLQTIDKVRTGNEQVITVFGCGGDRDKGKRPVMAKIACRLSDKVVMTSDNPRFEDPEEILDDMMKGLDPVESRKVLRIVDRGEAIKTACMLANKKDIVLVAGKGHETYQAIKGENIPFDDREMLNELLNQNKR